MDRRSRPYFCGVDQTLNFQQKEALAQGILQVVETIPEGFETFEFQFTEYQVHIYKLNRGMILLVLTQSDLVYSDYLKTIKDLKAVLQEDVSNAVATFQSIAGNLTLSGINYRRPRATQTIVPNITEYAEKPLPPAPLPTAQVETVNDPPKQIEADTAADATIKDLVIALNHLSKLTTQYLGTHVIANYWKSTRPGYDWLNAFQIDRTAQFSFTGVDGHRPLRADEQQQIQEWVSAFIQRGTLVIRNFSEMVQQEPLSAAQKQLLLGK